jgi:hypothetical protein
MRTNKNSNTRAWGLLVCVVLVRSSITRSTCSFYLEFLLNRDHVVTSQSSDFFVTSQSSDFPVKTQCSDFLVTSKSSDFLADLRLSRLWSLLPTYCMKELPGRARDACFSLHFLSTSFWLKVTEFRVHKLPSTLQHAQVFESLEAHVRYFLCSNVGQVWIPFQHLKEPSRIIPDL